MLRIAVLAVAAMLLLAAPAQAQTPREEKLPPVETGVVTEGRTMTPFQAEADRVADLGYTTLAITYYCQQKNLVGVILWRYNSRWVWTFGDYGIVRAADHWEWGDHTNLGWRYRGSRYLEGYGGINTPMVGRTVQGHFEFAPGGTFIRSKYIRLRAGVTGYGSYTWGPWCLD